jgi:hypothetical protein
MVKEQKQVDLNFSKVSLDDDKDQEMMVSYGSIKDLLDMRAYPTMEPEVELNAGGQQGALAEASDSAVDFDIDAMLAQMPDGEADEDL